MSEYIRVKGNITEKTGGKSKVFAKKGIEHNSNGKIKYNARSYSYADPEKYEPKHTENAVNVYIGMFFDGTGNNRFNSERHYYSKIKSSEAYFVADTIPASFEFIKTIKDKKQQPVDVKVKVTDRDSYWNPYSNIVKLHDLYKEVTTIDDKKEFGGEYVILKQYVEGIGTKRDEEDDILGSAAGRSDWGILSRVEQGIENMVNDQFSSIPTTKKINKIVFDVFGFSRGAAAARHFCNEVKKTKENKVILREQHEQSPKKNVIIPAGGLLGKKLEEKGYQPVGETYSIEIRFLGIFDTVVGDMVVKENLGYKLAAIPYIGVVAAAAQASLQTIKTNLSGLGIKKILHITAANEWRENFALTSANAGFTFTMLGAHSDIGGGYASLDKYKTVVDFFDVPVRDSSILAEKEKVKDFYVNHYFSKDKTEIDLINTYDHYIETTATPILGSKYVSLIQSEEVQRDGDYVTPRDRLYDPTKKHMISETKISDHYMITDQRVISNKYSLVSMYVMLQKAIDNEVPFYADYKIAIENNAKIDYPFEYELPTNDPILKDYLEEMLKASKKEDSVPYKIPSEMYRHICNKYVHLSAHYGGLDALYSKTGDHYLLGDYGFINHPVPYTEDEMGNITYKREIL